MVVVVGAAVVVVGATVVVVVGARVVVVVDGAVVVVAGAAVVVVASTTEVAESAPLVVSVAPDPQPASATARAVTRTAGRMNQGLSDCRKVRVPRPERTLISYPSTVADDGDWPILSPSARKRECGSAQVE
jgi:hypothetical protein